MSRIWTNIPTPTPRAAVAPADPEKPGRHRDTKSTPRCYKAAELIDARRPAGAR